MIEPMSLQNQKFNFRFAATLEYMHSFGGSVFYFPAFFIFVYVIS